MLPRPPTACAKCSACGWLRCSTRALRGWRCPPSAAGPGAAAGGGKICALRCQGRRPGVVPPKMRRTSAAGAPMKGSSSSPVDATNRVSGGAHRSQDPSNPCDASEPLVWNRCLQELREHMDPRGFRRRLAAGARVGSAERRTAGFKDAALRIGSQAQLLRPRQPCTPAWPSHVKAEHTCLTRCVQSLRDKAAAACNRHGANKSVACDEHGPRV